MITVTRDRDGTAPTVQVQVHGLRRSLARPEVRASPAESADHPVTRWRPRLLMIAWHRQNP